MSTAVNPDPRGGPQAQPLSSREAAGSEPELVEKHEEPAPTESHALADESAQASAQDRGHEKGVAQVQHDDVEVKDLGWNDDSAHVPRPLVGGLRNEDLWTLIRRFDKQIFHVKSIDTPPLAGLDMNIAEDEDFSPEKMRAQLERLYIVVVMGLFSFYKHVMRLRSWSEPRRTAVFLLVYGAAWWLDLLVPTIVAFLIVLVLSPAARHACFPPAPPALINAETGGVQKPPAGVLASDDSFTGAPEKHEGEAVEQEAHSFVNSISTVCSGVRWPLLFSS
jgi:hypothetical protein